MLLTKQARMPARVVSAEEGDQPSLNLPTRATPDDQVIVGDAGMLT
jgi:hypothetical protein